MEHPEIIDNMPPPLSAVIDNILNGDVIDNNTPLPIKYFRVRSP
jgi:hypothetical protein